MVLQRIVCLLSALFLCFCLAYSGESLKAHAALSGGRFMTTQEALETFGSSFTVKYFDGSDVVETVAQYQNTAVLTSVPGVAQSDYIQNGRSVLAYSFTGNISSNPEQIQMDIFPEYSLFDIDQLHTVILTPANATYTTPYQSPQWIWNFGGVRTVFEGLSSNGEMYRIPVDNSLCLYVPVDWESESLTSGYSVRALFSSGGLTKINGSYWVYLGIPYITYDAAGSNGTIGSTTSGTGDINVNVDMTETNSLLDDILDGLGNIVSGIGGLFIPDEHVFSDFWADLEQAIYDKLDPLYTVVVQIDRVFDNIRDTGAGTHFHIDGVTFPVGEGQEMTLGNWDVPIVPDIPGNNLPDGLMWTCKRIISIVCTLAFINMCKDKISLFFNPDAERID